jgi:hypothetical protein
MDDFDDLIKGLNRESKNAWAAFRKSGKR